MIDAQGCRLGAHTVAGWVHVRLQVAPRGAPLRGALSTRALVAAVAGCQLARLVCRGTRPSHAPDPVPLAAGQPRPQGSRRRLGAVRFPPRMPRLQPHELEAALRTHVLEAALQPMYIEYERLHPYA